MNQNPNTIDGPGAPPAKITISRDEYDDIKYQLSKLMGYHHMIRRLSVIVLGEEVSDQELAKLREEVQHFLREFGG
jgi:hypothetical protein